MIILFLDDNPHRTKKFVSEIPFAICTDTAQGMISLLKDLKETARYVFLDHDLAKKELVDSGGRETGMEVVRFIEANKPPVQTFVIHSMNPPAAIQMEQRLNKLGYEAIRVPFIYLRYEGIK